MDVINGALAADEPLKVILDLQQSTAGCATAVVLFCFSTARYRRIGLT